MALSDISFDITQGSTVGIVGESGSGKTTLAKALVGLIKSAHGEISTADNIIPTRDIQFVFQDPLAALNPRMTVEQLITEPLDYLAIKLDNNERLEKLKKIMEEVGLSVKNIKYFGSQPWPFPNSLIRHSVLLQYTDKFGSEH